MNTLGKQPVFCDRCRSELTAELVGVHRITFSDYLAGKVDSHKSYIFCPPCGARAHRAIAKFAMRP